MIYLRLNTRSYEPIGLHVDAGRSDSQIYKQTLIPLSTTKINLNLLKMKKI